MENKNNLICVSGKINSGKDLVGKIIQYLGVGADEAGISFEDWDGHSVWGYENNKFHKTSFQIKKYADKLKDMVCMLIGCTRADLESHDFKNKELGEEWWKYEQYDKSTGVWEDTSEDFYTRLQHVKTAKFRVIKPNPRLLLQLLGTDCGRQVLHPQIWVNAMFANYKGEEEIGLYDGGDLDGEEAYRVPKSSWIITDCRFENEAEAVKSRGGIVIRVERPCKNCPNKECSCDKAPEHASETGLDSYKGFDHIIINNGSIDDLVEKIRKLGLV